RWGALEARIRAVGAIGYPGVRAVLALETAPPMVLLEGDSSPPLAELLERGLELERVIQIITELARAIAATHHVGLHHGRLNPWSIQVGAADRVRFELTGLDTKPTHHDWALTCRAPELIGFPDETGDAATDIYAIGALLELFLRDRPVTPQVRDLVREMMANEPEARPSAIMLVHRLAHADKPPGMGAVTLDDFATPVRAVRPSVGLRIGRFELTRQLGVGAMGEVWMATDVAGGPDVAIKLLKPEIAADAELLRRFRKEARVLAKVGSPYIANFIDLNEDRGLHYLVLELVSGGSVAAALKRMARFPERLALGVVADTCRALSEPHRLGIVHRDIKPDNMMFVRAGIELETMPLGQVVKLGDFGIARIVEKSGGELEGATREGTVLGTPEYMAPEQCQGVVVTPATDVYALGCCLFALIAGRPPFQVVADNQMGVILQHLREQPARLDAIAADVSPQVADLVARCLAKDPKSRPADAAEVLAVLEQMCDGVAALITAHPAPPIHRASRIQTYRFEWELKASPEELWPFVSNTEKMNRAAGLAPVSFQLEQTKAGPGAKSDTMTTGSQRVGGMKMQWKEMPYEWIEGSRHVVLRVFDHGMLRWYVAEVTLERLAGGGTKVTNLVKLEPRSTIARVLSKWEIGVKYRRNLDRVYRRLDKVLSANPSPDIDPIDPEITLTPAGRARVAQLTGELGAAGNESAAIEALTSYLLHASDQDVARIRPLELAARFGATGDAMIDACLHAAKLGALAMVWDVICPSCRIPSNVVDSLQKIEEHGSCKACNIGYEVDFSRAIELAFRAAPEIRDVETRTFCVGGPAHFPHVAAQVRLAPGERFALPLSLGPGFYLVRSPQLARAHEFRVVAEGGVRRVDLTLGDTGELAPLSAGDQLLTIVNPDTRELVIRVERVGDRAFALTAARVMAYAAFRELFPDQQLAPGRLMSVTQATILVVQLDDASTLFRELGDTKAFPVAARYYELVSTLAKEYGGSLIKTFGGLAIAAFERPSQAVDVALALQHALDQHPVTTGLRCRTAVHRGPMMALSQGGRLDYFGQNVELALSIAGVTPPAVVALTSSVCQDVHVAERLQTTPDQRGMQPLGAGAWVLHVGARRGNPRLLPGADTSANTVIA
ncbi:MAG: protein kinase, partial [Deltaproteobacteria bacterium]|nr:protein kinase [Deltaproteobacteria bacterium]